MNTRKFEYLETIRETIESGDYDELDDYVEDIRDQVIGDPEFQEIFGEIKSKNYGDVISLIDEFIYQDIQSESDEFSDEETIRELGNQDSALDFLLKNKEALSGDISFEEFKEDDFTTGQLQDEDN